MTSEEKPTRPPEQQRFRAKVRRAKIGATRKLWAWQEEEAATQQQEQTEMKSLQIEERRPQIEKQEEAVEHHKAHRISQL